MATNTSRSTLSLTFNHVVFPPKLPGRADGEDEAGEVHRDMIRRLLHSIATLKNVFNEGYMPLWQSIEGSLEICRQVNGTGFVNKTELLDALKRLSLGHGIIVYIERQNACIFIRKPQ